MLNAAAAAPDGQCRGIRVAYLLRYFTIVSSVCVDTAWYELRAAA
jgi:hypothetical protein